MTCLAAVYVNYVLWYNLCIMFRNIGIMVVSCDVLIVLRQYECQICKRNIPTVGLIFKNILKPTRMLSQPEANLNGCRGKHTFWFLPLSMW